MKRTLSVLVFGEDGNDTRAIRELILALRPGQAKVETRRSPTVLVKGLDAARDRKNLIAIAAVVRAEQKTGKSCIVVTHRDCDQVEPAHEPLSKALEKGLRDEGVEHVVAATPAWCIEAWWFLWPDAVVAVNTRWRRPKHKLFSVGLIRNAKEEFKRAVRPPGRQKRPRDYTESDSPKIAAKVRELGIVNQASGASASFERFANRVRNLRLT
jgi:hypothetical protein